MTKFWIIQSSRGKRDEEISVVSNLERILRDVRLTAAASSAATAVRNPPIALKSLEAELTEVAARVPREECKIKFDGRADRTVLEERHVSRVRLAQSRLVIMLEDIARNEFGSIPDVVEENVR